ncbi:hypothetical protein [Secundilactobacillus kimchicus]|uniref:Uncharacterized protein n=1 Tax=Secundilactobacillus kimchicus JCM 15530 TaxID=1302272 RepID=A0A0R1HS41_9LACO|nr:hypothetical protein [Secundilactobacillus kimchicus]KRK49260.1 hypothetical protein FC96_GL000183 [Secundilactobacillus kimchicus JCM 15530]MBT9672806.1 hypothetical protein [Secundilactobacillus kimchicus]
MAFVYFIIFLFVGVGVWQYYQAYSKQVSESKHAVAVNRNPLQFIFRLLHLD